MSLKSWVSVVIGKIGAGVGDRQYLDEGNGGGICWGGQEAVMS